MHKLNQEGNNVILKCVVQLIIRINCNRGNVEILSSLFFGLPAMGFHGIIY